MVFHKRRVKIVHDRHCLVRVCTDNHAVRVHKVVDRGALFQELRIGDDIKCQSASALVELRLNFGFDLFSRAHGNR